ncbi:hypothetical protein RHSIM_Rhsim02G0085200 [Rhododendron simsii]|uniref:Uncharacterized protein n=1 Tax=Rhododendron simsii TaxID=118357 RepID=A0A834HMD6_RHOSS|nr:hypothetical protein RHSIM_Rhsim02G0085200 [Rhododendron simsii]
MANPEDTGPNSRNAKKPTPTELTKELEKLLMLILNEDDYAVQQLNKAICILSSLKENNARGNETTDEAIRVISSLRELKIKESVPKEFKRPMSREITELKIKESADPKESMSGEIMGDPVVVASGQEEDVSVVQFIPLPYYDESALSIGQQGSGKLMEQGEPSTRNVDRRVRKKIMWRISPLGCVPNMNEQSSILAWFDNVIGRWKGTEEGGIMLTLIPLILWRIWKCREEVVFNDGSPDPQYSFYV